MDDAFFVCRLQPVADLQGDFQKPRYGNDLQRGRINLMVKRSAFQQLHHNERLSFVIFNLVDGADVRMVQCRGGLRLPFKAAKRHRVIGDLGRQELERHAPTQL